MHICVVKNDGRDTSKEVGHGWRDAVRRQGSPRDSCRLFWLQDKELLYHFVSPVRDLLFIVMDRIFFFIPV